MKKIQLKLDEEVSNLVVSSPFDCWATFVIYRKLSAQHMYICMYNVYMYSSSLLYLSSPWLHEQKSQFLMKSKSKSNNKNKRIARIKPCFSQDSKP